MKKNNKLENLYKQSVININGEICDAKDAKISIFDRGFLYGDSIYEVAYSLDSNLIFFEDHIDRLYQSARFLNMQIYYSRDEIIRESIKTLQTSKISDAYIRIILTRGETEITLDPSSSHKNNLVIITKPKPIHPEIFYTNGIKLSIVSILRNDARSTNPSAKSGNYLNNVLAVSEAKKLQFDDALMENRNGFITEGSSFNIWFIKNGIIHTPPAESGLLKGITREKLIELCNKNKIPLKIENFTANELKQAQTVFITSSTRGIMPVSIIDEHKFNIDFNFIERLQKLYKELIKKSIENETYKY